LIAPYRFCRKCGKAQSQTETEEADQDLVIEEAGDDDFVDQDPYSESNDQPAEEPETTYASAWDYSAAPASTQRRTLWLIGGAAALVSVAILIAVAVTNSNRTPRSIENEKRIPEAPPGMVYIAGGDFMMGSNAGDEYERPAHRVSVAPFFIDVTEVTCEDYLKFLTATARRDPGNWTNETCAPGAAKRPVTGVDWKEAKAYADWADKRLPTEQEWEFAARGVLGTMYPWGNVWRPNAANAGDSSAQRIMEVGSYPDGKSPAGVMDLIGNAVEWTASDVRAYPGGSLSAPIPPDVIVVRGGSWRTGKQEATGTYRGFLHMTDANDYSVTGFRCVKDIGPQPVAQPKP
jgi:iron(II)-dependent oxidoreductase